MYQIKTIVDLGEDSLPRIIHIFHEEKSLAKARIRAEIHGFFGVWHQTDKNTSVHYPAHKIDKIILTVK